MEPIVPSTNNSGGTPSNTITAEPALHSKHPVRRPPLQFDDARRALIIRAAKVGIPHTKIAKALALQPKTLNKYFGPQLAEDSLQADLEVLHSLYDMATTHRNSAAAIFWAKSRCAHQPSTSTSDEDCQVSQPQTPISPKPPKSRKSSELDTVDSSKPVVFTVYNNDGEPNADY